jgi:ABC-type dipeptide/oligopeptide/nickel transport system permease component
MARDQVGQFVAFKDHSLTDHVIRVVATSGVSISSVFGLMVLVMRTKGRGSLACVKPRAIADIVSVGMFAVIKFGYLSCVVEGAILG